MARTRVTAYVIDVDNPGAGDIRDNHARQLAIDIMGSTAQATASFVHGEVDDTEIPRMEAAGLLVVRHEPVRRAAPQRAVRPRPMSARSFGLEGFEQGALAAFAADAIPAEVDYYTLTLRGPLLEPWREQLDASGVKIIEAAATGGYKVRLNTGDVGKLQALDFVESVVWIPPSNSVPEVHTESVAPAFGLPPAGLKMLTFDVQIGRAHV